MFTWTTSLLGLLIFREPIRKEAFLSSFCYVWVIVSGPGVTTMGKDRQKSLLPLHLHTNGGRKSKQVSRCLKWLEVWMVLSIMEKKKAGKWDEG